MKTFDYEVGIKFIWLSDGQKKPLKKFLRRLLN
jgi:hypothetical protein